MTGAMTGMILKCVGGFYTVRLDGGPDVTCRARGLFRKQELSPLAGDRAEIDLQPDGTGTVTGILPRKNSLVRPAVANVDKLFVVLSTASPRPNLQVADKMTAVALKKGIAPVVVITKGDLAPPSEIEDHYRHTGFPLYTVDNLTGQGADALRGEVRGSLCVFCGNSGVGKTTLLNRLVPELRESTGDISDKLGRGRHTTRKVELFPAAGGIIADTPGFSTVDTERYEALDAEELEALFPEFRPYLGKCRFTGCAHIKEKGCAVLGGLGEDKIAPARHASYAALYLEAKARNPWD